MSSQRHDKSKPQSAQSDFAEPPDHDLSARVGGRQGKNGRTPKNPQVNIESQGPLAKPEQSPPTGKTSDYSSAAHSDSFSRSKKPEPVASKLRPRAELPVVTQTQTKPEVEAVAKEAENLKDKSEVPSETALKTAPVPSKDGKLSRSSKPPSAAKTAFFAGDKPEKLEPEPGLRKSRPTSKPATLQDPIPDAGSWLHSNNRQKNPLPKPSVQIPTALDSPKGLPTSPIEKPEPAVAQPDTKLAWLPDPKPSLKETQDIKDKKKPLPEDQEKHTTKPNTASNENFLKHPNFEPKHRVLVVPRSSIKTTEDFESNPKDGIDIMTGVEPDSLSEVPTDDHFVDRVALNTSFDFVEILGDLCLAIVVHPNSSNHWASYVTLAFLIVPSLFMTFYIFSTRRYTREFKIRANAAKGPYEACTGPAIWLLRLGTCLVPALIDDFEFLVYGKKRNAAGSSTEVRKFKAKMQVSKLQSCQIRMFPALFGVAPQIVFQLYVWLMFRNDMTTENSKFLLFKCGLSSASLAWTFLCYYKTRMPWAKNPLRPLMNLALIDCIQVMIAVYFIAIARLTVFAAIASVDYLYFGAFLMFHVICVYLYLKYARARAELEAQQDVLQVERSWADRLVTFGLVPRIMYFFADVSIENRARAKGYVVKLLACLFFTAENIALISVWYFVNGEEFSLEIRIVMWSLAVPVYIVGALSMVRSSEILNSKQLKEQDLLGLQI